MNYRNDLSVYSSIDGNFRGGGGAQNIRGFHGWISALSTNILPMNEAILTTFTCSASSNHEKKPTTNVLTPWKLPAIRYSI